VSDFRQCFPMEDRAFPAPDERAIPSHGHRRERADRSDAFSGIPGIIFHTGHPVRLAGLFQQYYYQPPLSHADGFRFVLSFCLFFIRHTSSTIRFSAFLSGVSLGLLVLTRLELGILILPLLVYFIAGKKWKQAGLFCAGGSIALIAWVTYNMIVFGVPVSLAILKGDINHFGFNPVFIFENLLHPQSGVVFWTPLLIPGLILLFLAKDSAMKLLAFSSFLVVLLYLLKIPVMYEMAGGGTIDIGGLPVTAPETREQMRELLRSDINRYLAVLLPFAMVGIYFGWNRLVAGKSSPTNENK